MPSEERWFKAGIGVRARIEVRNVRGWLEMQQGNLYGWTRGTEERVREKVVEK